MRGTDQGRPCVEAVVRRFDRCAGQGSLDETANRDERIARRPVREPSPQPGRLHQRSPPENVLDSRRTPTHPASRRAMTKMKGAITGAAMLGLAVIVQVKTGATASAAEIAHMRWDEANVSTLR